MAAFADFEFPASVTATAVDDGGKQSLLLDHEPRQPAFQQADIAAANATLSSRYALTMDDVDTLTQRGSSILDLEIQFRVDQWVHFALAVGAGSTALRTIENGVQHAIRHAVAAAVSTHNDSDGTGPTEQSNDSVISFSEFEICRVTSSDSDADCTVPELSLIHI